MHKRLWGSISRKNSEETSERSIQNGDSPEASVSRGVRLFCESGGPNNSGDEVLHLPAIVEAAESSPAAAMQAAVEIRRFLSSKNFQRAYVQYNAIMLIRILADNPGKSFTRNIDQKFTATIKELLRDGRDMSVQQILRETLESFQTQKPQDETLTVLREMWTKEKTRVSKRGNMASPLAGGLIASPTYNPTEVAAQQNYFSRPHRQKGLPPPAELAQRISEAKTSAKLLSQVVQSTPPQEIPHNDLIKEFTDRCQSASRSMQGYIHADNPAPDEDTLLTLIETNDQLANAISKHQRALLQARRLTGVSPGGQTQQGPFEAPCTPADGAGYPPPPGPPPGQRQEGENPFADPKEDGGKERGEQQPLMRMNYGLPPEGVATPAVAAGMEVQGQGPTEGGGGARKARYRF